MIIDVSTYRNRYRHKYKYLWIEAEEDPLVGDSDEVRVNKLEVVEEDKENGHGEDPVVVMVEILLRMKDKLEDRGKDAGAEDIMEVVRGLSDQLVMA
mgnify:CR=1 FL=1